jgi:hypothetical protein
LRRHVADFRAAVDKQRASTFRLRQQSFGSRDGVLMHIDASPHVMRIEGAKTVTFGVVRRGAARFSLTNRCEEAQPGDFIAIGGPLQHHEFSGDFAASVVSVKTALLARVLGRLTGRSTPSEFKTLKRVERDRAGLFRSWIHVATNMVNDGSLARGEAADARRHALFAEAAARFVIEGGFPCRSMHLI